GFSVLMVLLLLVCWSGRSGAAPANGRPPQGLGRSRAARRADAAVERLDRNVVGAVGLVQVVLGARARAALFMALVLEFLGQLGGRGRNRLRPAERRARGQLHLVDDVVQHARGDGAQVTRGLEQDGLALLAVGLGAHRGSPFVV